MKKNNTPPTPRRSRQDDSAGLSSGTTAALNTILRNAYRRHARGRVARAAMTACLGR